MRHLDVDDPVWLRFVAASPAALPFHHPAWAGLLAATYGFRPFALALEGPGGGITAGLPVMEVRGPTGARRWVSLPFTDLCPPLIGPGADAAGLIAALDQTRQQAGIGRLEVRADLPGTLSRPCGEAVIHRLRLDADPQAVYRRFHKSQVRRNIERAEREGVTVRLAETRADVADRFYALHAMTRHRQAVPVQPKRYFRLLWDRLIEPGHGFALLAYAGGVPVAGAVFLAWNRTVIYKYGASDPAYWKLRPNHPIFWHAIRWACQHGYEWFDFGRTDLENSSLREFKSGWGAAEEPLLYGCLGGAGNGNGRGTAVRLLGAVIRRSPPWVGRALGELLYRYAA